MSGADPISEKDPEQKSKLFDFLLSALQRYFSNPKNKQGLAIFGQTIIAIALAMLIGAVLILIVGESPLAAYAALIKGAFGGVPAIARTLRIASPLILAGLAVSVAFRAGVINLSKQS